VSAMAKAAAISGLRRARTEDAPAIKALVRRAYGKYLARIGREPRPMQADYTRAIATHQLWVVEAGDGAAKGTLRAVLELVPSGDYLLVENIAVDPEAQGAGLGRALMGFAEAQARRQEFTELRLYTNERFGENLVFYGRLGYSETNREPLGDTLLVHMSKPLED
jgi:N-acetylglutamate synthase-like GNAT family acetyltransferase